MTAPQQVAALRWPRRPPGPGEHTEAILRELPGLDAASIAALREEQAV